MSNVGVLCGDQLRRMIYGKSEPRMDLVDAGKIALYGCRPLLGITRSRAPIYKTDCSVGVCPAEQATPLFDDALSSTNGGAVDDLRGRLYVNLRYFDA